MWRLFSTASGSRSANAVENYLTGLNNEKKVRIQIMAIKIHSEYYTFTDALEAVQKAAAMERRGKHCTIGVIESSPCFIRYEVGYTEITHTEEDAIENKR